MTWILFGSNGMLGTDIALALKEKNISYSPVSRQTCDITNETSIKIFFSSYKTISGIINCAAFTRVDDAETNKEESLLVNATSVKHLAKIASEYDCPFIHFSTDYVFSGTGQSPFTEDAHHDPINYYGYTKSLGESYIQQACSNYYIFRIQWLYGQHGVHFIDTIKRLATTRPSINVVNDQWGTLTSTSYIATTITSIITTPIPFGTYHLRNDGFCTWYDVADLIVDTLNLPCTVLPIVSSEFPRPAKRPLNGRLDSTKIKALNIAPTQHWKESLLNFLS